ncbi:uracil-DNA glycosylase [Falsarthrobacter nasiphocae]|uniref:Uracil-DNA glycosylase n=1 Tax=Falsarthrobacter nasiphocae TaxID=189863 RepID=A0AAE3YGV6_9MICC|nr:uracil-DNA glycosylase [Falsarthrobacter nasiphocae]MDR6891746.1 uracil-DNA glycosylase [Falsarthrobacter nasiphocae]
MNPEPPHPDWEQSLPGFARRAEELLDAAEQDCPEFLPGRERALAAFSVAPAAVRCVIIGQDPYPTPGHAMGLAFSAHRSVAPLPKSLANIYRELAADLPGEAPLLAGATADLSGWLAQGVLLLNTCLTVRPGAPGSHSRLGWQQLTIDALSTVVERSVRDERPLVLLEWGRHAQKVGDALPDGPLVRRIASAHPSPLSASRGFFGSRPFSRANEHLTAHGLEPVDWVRSLLDPDADHATEPA